MTTLDNTTLYHAAEALEREADLVASYLVPGDDLVETIRHDARMLREIADASLEGEPHPGIEYTAAVVVVQGVITREERSDDGED